MTLQTNLRSQLFKTEPLEFILPYYEMGYPLRVACWQTGSIDSK